MSSNRDPTDREAPSRYVVGIDLGTTNSAVALVDMQQLPRQLRTLEIPQVVAPFQIEGLETLPSFHYQTTPTEAETGALRLPWSDSHPSYAVGEFSREEGISKPGRLIAVGEVVAFSFGCRPHGRIAALARRCGCGSSVAGGGVVAVFAACACRLGPQVSAASVGRARRCPDSAGLLR